MDQKTFRTEQIFILVSKHIAACRPRFIQSTLCANRNPLCKQCDKKSQKALSSMKISNMALTTDYSQNLASISHSACQCSRRFDGFVSGAQGLTQFIRDPLRGLTSRKIK